VSWEATGPVWVSARHIETKAERFIPATNLDALKAELAALKLECQRLTEHLEASRDTLKVAADGFKDRVAILKSERDEARAQLAKAKVPQVQTKEDIASLNELLRRGCPIEGAEVRLLDDGVFDVRWQLGPTPKSPLPSGPSLSEDSLRAERDELKSEVEAGKRRCSDFGINDGTLLEMIEGVCEQYDATDAAGDREIAKLRAERDELLALRETAIEQQEELIRERNDLRATVRVLLAEVRR
jgi:hypothetical protein